MSSTLPKQIDGAHRVIPEIDRKAQKASLRIPENGDFLVQIGDCLDIARRDAGWTLDQLAAELKRDARQVRRWIAGEERTQVDAVFAVPELREPFVIALAKLAKCCVETIVTIRRSA
jgi:ribosome-binding protein aMBF1 (putative translation factor)